ncbi:Dabb family protein [Salinibacterium sp. G-O1]|uniref:Dabb family protein n=1 Tax=Salinibacterium sp. G-O1 TaxID=3046208 RepID=UPI0024BAB660|nr:Dabb family protein [Salinibacterium sp. G-O1]MDJ0336316.1 Dabb family protein [Salinibacterium sp. G-O1]
MIEHTVCFSLLHDAGSAEEKEFLQAAVTDLAPIQGVEHFRVARQISAQSDFRWQLSMQFVDDDAYRAYNEHPDHQKFVGTRWATEVVKFQELDFIAETPS